MSDSTSNTVSFPTEPNPQDRRPLPEIVAEHYGFALAYADYENGKRYYAVQDWIIGVAQTANPRRFWSDLKKRLKNAINSEVLYDSIVQLPYRAINGRIYQMDFAPAETLYQITQRMVAETGLRDRVLQFLAKSGVVIDEIRIDPDKAIEAAIQAYKRQGKSDRWIEVRIKSKIQRLKFTAAFKKALRTPPSSWQYAIVTDEMRLGLWKRSTAELKTEMGLKKKESLRDHQSDIAITYETLAEQISEFQLNQKQKLEFDSAKTIVRKTSEFVGKQADEAGQMLGIDIATNRPLLT